jgi:hypothetical protein
MPKRRDRDEERDNYREWGSGGPAWTGGERDSDYPGQGDWGSGGRNALFGNRSDWTREAGGGNTGSYSGGMGSFTGGAGSYADRGQHSEQRTHAGRGPKGWQRSDERIREDVNERLTDDPHVDASEMEVRVDGGEVTLDGIVETRAMKRRAEDVVHAVSGVKDVHNRLRVQPSGLPRL